MKNRKIFLSKLTLIILLNLFVTEIFSQAGVYKPFPVNGTWTVETYGPTGPLHTGEVAYTSYTRYETAGDTTIGAYIYKKVTSAGSNLLYGPPWTWVVTYYPSIFNFAYRNDVANKKVYLFKYMDGQYTDTLFYDFDLEIGDTLKQTFSLNYGDPIRTVVTSIDSVLICNLYHKRFKFSCDTSWSMGPTDLIEGIGFADNFLNTSSVCLFEPSYLYSTSFSCLLLSVNETPGQNLNQMEIFPNPVNNSFQIKYSEKNLVFPLKYSIEDCFGRSVVAGLINEKEKVDVSIQTNGIYFITLQDEQKKISRSKFVKQ